MKSGRAGDPFAIETAGQYVEVIDRRSKLRGAIGSVAFFVGDNIYVTFAGRRWAPTKMFFADQLRAVPAPQHSLERKRAATFLRSLRVSLAKMRL